MQPDIARQNYEALTAEALARLRFQVVFAELALWGLMLASGGAAVALWVVIGQAAAVSLDVGRLWAALCCFVAGVVLALASCAVAFASQHFYYVSAQHEAWNYQDDVQTGRRAPHDHVTPYRQGHWAQIAGVGFAILSLAAFAVGSAFALSGALPA